MSMIKAEHLTFSYPSSSDPIFEDVNFQIDTDWKLGFVGRNGRGKTTFLNLLMGKYEYRGTIHSSVSFDYFPYEVSDPSKMTLEIMYEICPDAQDWEFMKELSCLQTDCELLWRPFSTLSKGEQTKALLAALFLNQGHFLLIDEPTNHLDAAARETVAAYLKKKRGFILVSHDRFFLDSCVDHILSLNRADIEVQSGNFSSWMTNFTYRQACELAQNEQLKKEIGRLKQASARTAGWSDQIEASKIGSGCADRGFVGHKSAKMMQRAKSIQSRQQKAIEEKSGLLKNTETAEALKLLPLRYRSQTLISCRDLSIRYGDRTVCGPVSFTLEQGERLALNGKNGSGKSSLLKLILGEDIKKTGTISIGSGLIISYVSQDTSHLSGTLSDYASQCRIDESLFKAILRKLDFERIQFTKDMAQFSGGQKKKVLIAKSLCEQAHLYLWDEPLNFIDIYSRMQIEQLILDFRPTMIFVEHDRAFRETIATKTLEL